MRIISAPNSTRAACSNYTPDPVCQATWFLRLVESGLCSLNTLTFRMGKTILAYHILISFSKTLQPHASHNLKYPAADS